MAFNPFHAFQKNKKFWMAAVLLITMVTFVFCSGRGDMQDWLLRMFSKRGTTIATVGSYNLTREDLSSLRSNRNMVNEFMLKCCRITADNITKFIQDEQKKPLPADDKKKKDAEQFLVELNTMQMSLVEKLRHPRYFEGGVKFDDLIEFKIWQVQADRLGVKLLDEDVDFLVRQQFFSSGRQIFISAQQMLQAQFNAKGGTTRDVSELNFRRALTDEFRVRLAKLAMIEMQTGRFYQNRPQPFLDPTVPDEERAHVTLAQIWKVFQEKRAELDVTLIPVHVADFSKEVFEQKPPTDAELEKLFEKYRKEKYDPASPVPSFESPPEVKVEFVMADPTSPLYLGAARAKLSLETTLPLIGSPLQAPLVAAARAGAFAAGKQKVIDDVLEGLSRPKAFELYRTADLGADQFIWPMAAHFAQEEPRAIASFIANSQASLGVPALPGAQAWAGFLGEAAVPRAAGNAGHAAEIETGIAAEAKRRTKPYAVIAASSAIGQPAGMAAAVFMELKLQGFGGRLYSDLLLFPTPIIERDLEKVLENRTAERWASRNLLAVKRQLDAAKKPEAVKKILSELDTTLVTHGKTKRFYNRYDIDQAPELKDLKEAYDKYYMQINWFEKRDITPDRMLKDTDFYKLFFENERFTSAGKYQVRPWPPDVVPSQLQVRTLPGMHAPLEMPNIDQNVLADVQQRMRHQDPGEVKGYKLLDKAQKPILFWRIDDRPAEIPQTLAAARPKVIEAWKIEQARELRALPIAKKIAEDLLLAGGDYTPEAIKKATLEGGRKHGKELLIPKLAPLAPKEIGDRFKGGRREYYSYPLPKDAVPLPHKNMVAQLLSLYDLKQPIEIKTERPDGEPAFVKELNDLNKALFDKAKKEKKREAFVQVLTNEPENIYYVAIVTRPPTADPKDFQESVIAFASELQFQFRPVDSFVTRAQEFMAKDFHDKLLMQMRDEIGFSISSSFEGKDRQEFDKSADTGG